MNMELKAEGEVTKFTAIDVGKTNEIDAGTTADIANAYDFDVQ